MMPDGLQSLWFTFRIEKRKKKHPELCTPPIEIYKVNRSAKSLMGVANTVVGVNLFLILTIIITHNNNCHYTHA